MNKFEQASSDGHQMSLVGMCGWEGPCSHVQGVSSPSLISGEGQSWAGGVCTMRSNASWLMVTWGPPCVQTHTCENNTFPQIRWRVVITMKYIFLH